MTPAEVVDVRFFLDGGQRPKNPFKFHGKGALDIEADFVTVRG